MYDQDSPKLPCETILYALSDRSTIMREKGEISLGGGEREILTAAPRGVWNAYAGMSELGVYKDEERMGDGVG